MKVQVVCCGLSAFVCAAFAAVIVINILLDRKGIPVEYAEGMEERARLYKEPTTGIAGRTSHAINGVMILIATTTIMITSSPPATVRS